MQKQQLIMSIVSILILIGIIGGISLLFSGDEPENEHVHRFNTVVEVTDCTKGGTTTMYCAGCNYKKVTKITPKDHNLVVSGSKDVSCLEAGYTEYTYCSECTYTDFVSFTEPLGHSWGEDSCTRCGISKSAYELSGTWKFNSKVKRYSESEELDCKFEFYVNGVWYDTMYIDDSYVYICNDDTDIIPFVYKFSTNVLNEELATIQIKGVQFVGEKFYTWFTENAVKVN